MSGLQWKTGLRRLRLQRCHISPRGCAHLGRLLYEGGRCAVAALQHRQQSAPTEAPTPEERRRLSAAGKATIGGYADTLEQLVLSGNYLGAAGPGREFCQSLPVTVSLKVLSLACCSLGDAGVQGLFEVLSNRGGGHRVPCDLQELDLSHNSLGPATARALVNVLACNEHLRTLHVKANDFGAGGALAVADCVRCNRGRLQRLDVSQNRLFADGARTIVEAFAAPVAFAFRISRKAGQPHGATFTADMKVMGILPHSVFDRWNENNPADQIRIGDYVVRVNDKRLPKQMNLELSEETNLEIAVHRPGASLAYLDVSYNGIMLPGLQELQNDIGRFSGSTMQGPLLVWPEGRQVNVNAA